MRKFISGFIGLLVVVTLALFGAGPASAATSFDSCSSGGTTTSFTLFYSTSGSSRTVSNFNWSTSPAALLNRIALDVQDNGASYTNISAAGGTTDTLNDVPSSQNGYSGPNLPVTLSGGGAQYKFRVYGGVGNSTDSCSTGWHSF